MTPVHRGSVKAILHANANIGHDLLRSYEMTYALEGLSSTKDPVLHAFVA